MTATTEALAAIQGVPTGGDPVLDAAKWVVLVLIMIGSASVPFMWLMNKRNKDKNENIIESAISGAGSTLYNQLIKQVEEYRKIADSAFKERNDLIERVAKLEAAKEDADRLRSDLLTRDDDLRDLLKKSAEERSKFMEMLTSKDKDIQRRDERIGQLEKLMKSMEIRLARAEERQVASALVCPLHSGQHIMASDSGGLPISVAISGGTVSDSLADN